MGSSGLKPSQKSGYKMFGGKKISLWTFLILFIAFGFKPEEEMIPGELDWSLKRLEYSSGSLKT